MRFTLIGHSTLAVATRGPSILVDPWLFGSCYWRAWWHFPPSTPPSDELLAPDYVYLTHHHFDHFHYPTLRRIDKRAHVLVPRFGVDVMVDEVRRLGFEQVTELPHGEVVSLAPDVRVASYQYGFDDTTFVIADGDDVLVDVNDCKLRGRALEQVREDFPRPTFMFKSHSWAQSYPNCYEADDPADLGLLSRDAYVSDFLDAARAMQPQYAVPFGSMVAFLHPDTLDLNRHLVTPLDVRDASDDDIDVVAMTPGDVWDSEAGFTIVENDWYARREEHLDELAASVQPIMDRLAEAEAGVTIAFETFAEYVEQFMQALPGLVTRRLLERPMAFEVPSSPEPWWILDFANRRVRSSTSLPDDVASIVRVPEAVLVDAIDNRILHFVHGSMRIRTRLRPGGANEDLAFWGLLMVWEIGYLPITKVLNPRFAGVLWRRRREIGDALGALRGSGSVLQRLSQRFAPPSSGVPAGAPSSAEDAPIERVGVQ